MKWQTACSTVLLGWPTCPVCLGTFWFKPKSPLSWKTFQSQPNWNSWSLCAWHGLDAQQNGSITSVVIFPQATSHWYTCPWGFPWVKAKEVFCVLSVSLETLLKGQLCAFYLRPRPGFVWTPLWHASYICKITHRSWSTSSMHGIWCSLQSLGGRNDLIRWAGLVVPSQFMGEQGKARSF